MSKEELLSTEFKSAPEAMHALAAFLDEVDKSWEETRGKYQNLRVIGNKIFE